MTSLYQIAAGIAAVIIGIAAAVTAKSQPTQPAPPPPTSPSTTAPIGQPAALTTAQRAIANLITDIAKRNGESPAMAAAMVVNAYAESALDPNAVGDGGNSVGLFQLHARGGGRGMTVEQRKDPTANTERILQELNDARRNSAAAAALSSVATVADLTAWFSTYVERPADKPAAETRRRQLCARMYPNVCNLRTDAVTWS